MLTATANSLSRTIIAAALAVTGTIASFAVTVGPAHAQGASRGYTATLTAKLDAPKRSVVNGVVWNCTGDTCSGPVDGARPLNTCAQVAKEFGKVSTFVTPKGELDADKLARCNAAA